MLSKSVLGLLVILSVFAPALMKVGGASNLPEFTSFVAVGPTHNGYKASDVKTLKAWIKPKPSVPIRAYVLGYQSLTDNQKKYSRTLYDEYIQAITQFEPTFTDSTPALSDAERAIVGDRPFGEIVVAWREVNSQKKLEFINPEKYTPKPATSKL